MNYMRSLVLTWSRNVVDCLNFDELANCICRMVDKSDGYVTDTGT